MGSKRRKRSLKLKINLTKLLKEPELKKNIRRIRGNKKRRIAERLKKREERLVMTMRRVIIVSLILVGCQIRTKCMAKKGRPTKVVLRVTIAIMKNHLMKPLRLKRVSES